LSNPEKTTVLSGFFNALTNQPSPFRSSPNASRPESLTSGAFGGVAEPFVSVACSFNRFDNHTAMAGATSQTSVKA
jgi:hypothetical protein